MKLNWSNVLFCYGVMAIMGATCWVYCTWSFRDMWMGSLVGVALFTAFMLSIFASEFYHKFKHKIPSWKKLFQQPPESH